MSSRQNSFHQLRVFDAGELEAEADVAVGEALLIRNADGGIALLPQGQKQFSPGLRFSATNELARRPNTMGSMPRGIIPGPLRAILLNPGFRHAGGSHFAAAQSTSAPSVTSYTCKLTEQVPLFVEARVRYTFENGGFCEVTFRVLDGDPAIQVDEQCPHGLR